VEARAFERLVGAEHVRLSPAAELDGVPVQLVVSPATQEEVAACLAEARERGVALVPSTGGTKLRWGNRASARALARLDLSRLARIVELDAAEGVATVEAGVRLDALAAAAAAHGKRAHLDSGHAGESAGGVIATEAFGLEYAPGRRVRNELLGLRVALPDGTLARCGGRVVKNVTGFDLVRLQCGAFGTLGVIVEATLRLRPQPAATAVLGRSLPSWREALAFAHDLVARGVEPVGVAAEPAGRGARVFWRLEGSEADLRERAGRAGGEALADPDWQRLRRARTSLATPARVRLGARPSDTHALVEACVELAGAAAPLLALPAAGIAFAGAPEPALDALVERAGKQRWLALVEVASPAWKAGRDVFGRPPEALPLMRELRRRFDPAGVLSPGRFVGGI
jgi:glycolate oxidase FAD binding subunit